MVDFPTRLIGMDGLAVGAAITLAVILFGFAYFYVQTLD